MRMSDWSSDVCSSDLKVTDVQASLRFDQTDSLALLGLGEDGVGAALRRESRTQNWEGSASLNGMLGDWRWSLTGNYADADQRTFTEQGDGARDRLDSRPTSFGTHPKISGHVTNGSADCEAKRYRDV